jgi:hypothetical protein
VLLVLSLNSGASLLGAAEAPGVAGGAGMGTLEWSTAVCIPLVAPPSTAANSASARSRPLAAATSKDSCILLCIVGVGVREKGLCVYLRAYMCSCLC